MLEKRCWPWGRIVAGTVAGVILCFGANFFVDSVKLRREADEARIAEPIRLQVDLSKPGVYSGKLHQTFVNAHGNYLHIMLDRPLASRDEAAAIVAGLRGSLSIADMNGTVVCEDRFDASRIYGVPLVDREHWVPAIEFGHFAKGDYMLKIVIVEGAPRLSGVPHAIVGHYALCGMEYVVSTIAIWLGIACCMVAGVIFLFIVIVSRRKAATGTRSVQTVRSHAEHGNEG